MAAVEEIFFSLFVLVLPITRLYEYKCNTSFKLHRFWILMIWPQRLYILHKTVYTAHRIYELNPPGKHIKVKTISLSEKICLSSAGMRVTL